MKIAYFDCVAGISGDMILGSLIDAGLTLEKLKNELAKLNLNDFDLIAEKVMKNAFSATKVTVITKDAVHARHLKEIRKMIKDSELDDDIKEPALNIFQKIGEAEANIHNTDIQNIHFHELGAVDTIIDVVGSLVGLKLLGIEKITASPVPVGRGFIKGAHGMIPLPAPATLSLLKGIPVKGTNIQKELVTPTGAAILGTVAQSFGEFPEFSISSTGIGAGGWDLEIPNILRLVIGESDDSPQNTDSMLLLETNIDDMNPEIYEYVMESLFEAGATDVWIQPIQMKKNRPAISLSVLCEKHFKKSVEHIIFSETGTLGIREIPVTRHILTRDSEKVKTPYGLIAMKVRTLSDGSRDASPEYEDCKRAAKEKHIPLKQIYEAAQEAWRHSKT